MVNDSPKNYDARTGCPVDCLPAKKAPEFKRHVDGHIVTTTTVAAAIEALKDHNYWMQVRHKHPELTR